MSDRIAVFGDKESIYGFAALGLDTYFIEDGVDPTEDFKNLCKNSNCSIIFVTEAVAAMLEREIEKYRDQASPAIILIPGVTGNTGVGLEAIRTSVEKAVGSDIFND